MNECTYASRQGAEMVKHNNTNTARLQNACQAKSTNQKKQVKKIMKRVSENKEKRVRIESSRRDYCSTKNRRVIKESESV